MRRKLTAMTAVVAAFGLIGIVSYAQDAAPVAPTKKMLNNALNSTTRQTLQQAMESIDPAALAVPETSLTLGPGEAAEIDGTKASRIDFASLPAPVRAALSGGARRTLSDSAAK